MKKNIIKIVVLFISVFMLFGCFGNNNNDNNNNTNNNQGNEEPELQIYDFSELDVSDYQTVGITKDFKIGNTTLKFESDGFDQNLYVGNFILFSSTSPYYNLDGMIYGYGDSFVFSANNRMIVYLFDSLNQKLVSYETFYENNLHTKDCKMESKGLTLTASAFVDGKLDLGNGLFDTLDSCSKYNQYKDYIASATIFVKYLGNSKFDGYRIIQSTKISDINEYKNLCN